ncbi:MAG: 1-deoxy-D-xylulose-5-phosphate reductoisomerase [Clostridia bacterium]|nr:1-deoxy-D-xylulose-5-phosphate reductoisomerase [Clostridia bacterium]
MRQLSILGSTGSIGTQALAIAALHPERFRVAALTAHRQAEALFAQVRAFRPQMAGLTGMTADEVNIPDDLCFCDWRFGQEALLCAARDVPCDDVLVSVVGMVGLPAVMAACADGAGGPTLIPVDSEHSAICQCLKAAQGNPYETIWLTASGGAFRSYTKEQLENATLAQALTHPNWSMGAKITVDSASMFNKALEIIEARWLFSARPEQIRVLIHPQSIVHSMVEFRDGAVLAQLGAPDMRVPIAYAMAYPERIETQAPRADFAALGQCTFFAPDMERFPALRLAYESLAAGGAACCALNAANEEANARFRAGGLRFVEIGPVVEETLSRLGTLPANTIEQVYAADGAARRAAREIMEKL